MSTIRFRAREIDLELHGSEPFVTRQLLLLAPFLRDVDVDALDGAPRRAPVLQEPATEAAPVVSDEPVSDGSAAEEPPAPDNGRPEAEGQDGLLSFYRSFRPSGRDRQADAALIFSYYLHREEGMDSLGVGDLIRCCIRAGVDTRNFNRALGTLTRRGLLEAVRHGHAYRISDQGVAAVESRM